MLDLITNTRRPLSPGPWELLGFEPAMDSRGSAALPPGPWEQLRCWPVLGFEPIMDSRGSAAMPPGLRGQF